MRSARPGAERAASDDAHGALRIAGTGIAWGPTFDSVGSNTTVGEERGARGLAPTLYFTDPDKHLLEIRTYES